MIVRNHPTSVKPTLKKVLASTAAEVFFNPLTLTLIRGGKFFVFQPSVRFPPPPLTLPPPPRALSIKLPHVI